MCLILVAHRVRPDLPLVIAANRDEFHSRPTLPATFWEEDPHIFAGRDLQAGGTWLGASARGRLAALTAYREPHPPAGLSRGLLVANFLTGDHDPYTYTQQVGARGKEFPGFNLLVWEKNQLHWMSNRGGNGTLLEPGYYGLSNALLNSTWPKVQGGLQAFRDILSGEISAPEPFFQIMRDHTSPPDELLPDTGVGLDKERFLGPRFILSPVYGTRCSTVIFLREGGILEMWERTWDEEGNEVGTVAGRLEWGD